MAQSPSAPILDYFADLDNHRVERTRRHNWWDSSAIAIGAVRGHWSIEDSLH